MGKKKYKKKKKNILITLLTSNNIVFLKTAYQCLKEQLNTTLNYTIVIIVNTLDEIYYKQVITEFNNILIERTKSNGYPGKGHNSVLTYFRNHTEYDYIITLDGDDFLYPYALHNLEKYLQSPYNPDILLLPFSDNITIRYNNNSLMYPISTKCYLAYNFKTDNLDMMDLIYTTKLNPFTNHLRNINTAGRLFCLSRKALDMNLYYDEKLKWYDDVHVFLQILDYNTISSYFNIFYLEEFNIYLYNCLNNNSATNMFLKNTEHNYIEEDKLFRLSIKDKFLSIRRWDLKTIKVLHNPNNHQLFSIIDKIKWVKNLIQTFGLHDIHIQYDNLNKLKQFMIQENQIELSHFYNKENII